MVAVSSDCGSYAYEIWKYLKKSDLKCLPTQFAIENTCKELAAKYREAEEIYGIEGTRP